MENGLGNTPKIAYLHEEPIRYQYDRTHKMISEPQVKRVVARWEFWQTRILLATGKTKQMAKNNAMPTFINGKVSKEEKIAFKKWQSEKDDKFFDVVTDFLASGYKVSVRYDVENDTWITATTCWEDPHVNKGYCMMSRAGDWVTALLLPIFKTQVLCEDGSWSDWEEEEDWG